MKLTFCQKKALEQIWEKYRQGSGRVLDFKSPTGSGKTFIISHLISKIFLNKESNEKIVVFLATISSAELPKQFSFKVQKYMEYLPFQFKVEYKISPSVINKGKKDYEYSLLAEDNKLIVVGRSSFTKNSIFVERGIFEQFLDQVQNENYQLIYIRDEAHYGGIPEKKKFIDKFGFESKIQKAADFVLRMTATFNPIHQQITISEDELKEDELENNECCLLKKQAKLNCDLESSPEQMSDIEFLKTAIIKFKKVKKDYKKLGLDINPAMLIQVDSKTQKNSLTFEKNLQEIIDELNNANLYWIKYFGEKKESKTREKISLSEISKNSSPVDAIIFKIGPATGWDIPRACMLVQLRNVNSVVLNQQTLGRIKRNPMPDLTLNKVTNKYYLYSNYQESTRKMHHYTLVEKHKKVKWFQGVIEVQEKVCKQNYKQKIKHFLQSEIYRIKSLIDVGINKKELIYQSIDIKTISGQKKVGGQRFIDAINLKFFLQTTKLRYEKFLLPIKSIVQQVCIEHKIKSLDIFWFVLISFYMEKLIFKFNQTHGENLRPQYLLKEGVVLPWNYIIWEDTTSANTVDYQNFKNYAYINSDKNNLYKQVLDSKAESIFMREAIAVLSKTTNNQFLGRNQIQVWAKNPALTSSVSLEYLEYFDKEFIKKRAFIDFIFKIRNSYIYVEVKSDFDYNPKKTSCLQKAFEEYAKKSNINSVFSIVKVEKNVLDFNNYSKLQEIERKHPFQRIVKLLINKG